MAIPKTSPSKIGIFGVSRQSLQQITITAVPLLIIAVSCLGLMGLQSHNTTNSSSSTHTKPKHSSRQPSQLPPVIYSPQQTLTPTVGPGPSTTLSGPTTASDTPAPASGTPQTSSPQTTMPSQTNEGSPVNPQQAGKVASPGQLPFIKDVTGTTRQLLSGLRL